MIIDGLTRDSIDLVDEYVSEYLSDRPLDCWRKAKTILEDYESRRFIYRALALRICLGNLLVCFWYAEPVRIAISCIMHAVGREVKKVGNCHYKFDGDEYYTDCPVQLLHKDFGFSMRAKEKYTCSICGLDILDCEHITGREYDGVRCIRIVEVEAIYGFDFVKEPEFPEARITKIPLPREHIEDSIINNPLCDEIVYGETMLFCTHCLDCKGYDPKINEEKFNSIGNK